MFASDFEEKLYQERQEKLKKIAELGRQNGLDELSATYPNSFPLHPEGGVPAIRAQHDDVTTETLDANKPEVSVPGRVMAHRRQGKVGFAVLQNNGKRLQMYVRQDAVGENAFELYKLLDLGDHVGVTGYLFRTRTGELTIHVTTLTFLSKSMLPLPDKYHGLQDIELRYRQRYLDLFTDEGEEAPAPSTETSAEHPDDPEAIAAATAPYRRLPARDVFVKRAQVLKALRKFFDERGYLEVETPMMQPIAGGAAARPFVTHHNSMDMDLYLRIAPELYLKRLVVGGLDRVYEINRNFRNEGISTQHNPEFTMLEFYQAYANHWDLMDLTEELIKFVANEVNGTTLTSFPIPKGPRAGEVVQIDLGKWQRLSMREAIMKFWDQRLGKSPSLDDLSDYEKSIAFLTRSTDALEQAYKHAVELDQKQHPNLIHMPPVTERGKTRYPAKIVEIAAAAEIEDQADKADDSSFWNLQDLHYKWNSIMYSAGIQSYGRLIATVFELLAEHHLIQPTIIYDFPLAVSPLSKVKSDEPDWVERFEFYIGGFEVGNAFSELNDPEDQRHRFAAQLGERERGDDEAHQMDADYVRALAYGLPPTAGEGIGIDRLVMLLTGSRSIRDVILFPLLRPPKQPVLEKSEPPADGQS